MIQVTVAQAIDRAVEFYQSGDLAQAATICDQVLSQCKTDERAWRLKGVIARREGRIDESLRILSAGVEILPRGAKLWNELGNTLREMERFDEAADAYRRAIDAEPGFGIACTNYAATLQRLERYDEAIPWSQRAVELNPTCSIARYNLGAAYAAIGSVAEACAAFEQTIALDPNHALAHWNRGVCSLLAGDYERGWDGFEWRVAAGEVELDRRPEPRWDGSPLAGKTIVVHAEQGIGDEILFATCLPDVISQAEQVFVTCEPRLAPLFERSFPQAEIIPWRRLKDWSPAPTPIECDYQIPAGSLPYFLRRSLDQFPRCQNVLKPSSMARAKWVERFERLGLGLKVGIAWRAGGKPSEHRRRTIPLAEWAPILTAADVHFVSLQYGACEADIASAAQMGVEIHDFEEGDPLVDFDDYAAKIAALDLVISVGNATVHAAGAVGTPTYAILPHVPSWRWSIKGERTPWYPSVRLFHQPANKDWQPALREVGERLAALARRPFQPRAVAPAKGPAKAPSVAPADADRVKEAFDQALKAYHAGNMAEAHRLCEAILLTAPRHSDALILLGQLAMCDGQTEVAIRSFRRAVAASPNAAACHCHLAQGLLAAERTDEAIDALQTAVRLNPSHVQAQNLLGETLLRAGRHADAIPALQSASTLDAKNHITWQNLATAFRQTGQTAEAQRCYRQGLELAPESYPSLVGLATLLSEEGEFAEAESLYRRALETSPNCAETLQNLGMALNDQGKCEEALVCFERAIDLRPDYAMARANRALVLLQLGWFAEGWTEYRWRWQCPTGAKPRDHFPQPLWNGESLCERTILVHGEQGVGDEIMFASCYPEVIAQSGRCIITCDRRLAPLFARSFPSADVWGVERGTEHNWLPPADELIDVQIPAGCLPRYLRTDEASYLRTRKPYLKADEARVRAWRERFDALGEGPKIGIAWRGGVKPLDRKLRWTALDDWSEILSTRGVTFINLQYDDCREEIADARRRYGVDIHAFDDISLTKDLDEMAAQIAALDLVISVGNAGVHMAGALGVEAWALLPCHGAWRWLRGRHDTLWYASVRLFRQPTPGDWRGVMQRVQTELLSHLRHFDDNNRKPANSESIRRPHSAPHFAPSPKSPA